MTFKPLNSGDYDRRVTIQELVETVDVYGQPVQTWRNLFDRWVNIRSPSATEVISAERLNVILTHIIEMRYDPQINETQQILFRGRTFRIHSVRDEDERQIMMTLKCVEQSEVSSNEIAS